MSWAVSSFKMCVFTASFPANARSNLNDSFETRIDDECSFYSKIDNQLIANIEISLCRIFDTDICTVCGYNNKYVCQLA